MLSESLEVVKKEIEDEKILLESFKKDVASEADVLVKIKIDIEDSKTELSNNMKKVSAINAKDTYLNQKEPSKDQYDKINLPYISFK